MDVRTFLRPGLAIGAVLALPFVAFVLLPTVVTFVEWLGRVPATILGVIVPGGDDRATGTSRG